MTEIKSNNLKHSLEIPFLVEKIKLEEGEYKRGEVVEYDYSTKIGKKITAAEKIYGIVPEAVKVEGEKEISVYISGIFNKKEIVAATISDKDSLKEPARALNIYFR
ncbi:MAG: hypothetical protein CR959_01330 [Fusobacteriales bacterium]|nr:hypothetical protein [Fusobacterium sp.]PID67212.1 MAG: hypothetical protein CR959_01330 [Fusobacteriales bacterium]